MPNCDQWAILNQHVEKQYYTFWVGTYLKCLCTPSPRGHLHDDPVTKEIRFWGRIFYTYLAAVLC